MAAELLEHRGSLPEKKVKGKEYEELKQKEEYLAFEVSHGQGEGAEEPVPHQMRPTPGEGKAQVRLADEAGWLCSIRRGVLLICGSAQEAPRARGRCWPGERPLYSAPFLSSRTASAVVCPRSHAQEVSNNHTVFIYKQGDK